MIHLSIVPHGEAAAVVIPSEVLDAAGLRIGDILAVTLQDRQLVLQSNADAAPSTDREITQEVLECRREAYQRQVGDNTVHEKPERILQKLPFANQRARDQERFDRLADAWKKDTFLLSKISVKVMHSAYQKIIGMGPAAVPFILKELAEQGPNHWFWALHAITGENPVPTNQVGNIAAMTEAWLQWGRKNGYLDNFPTSTGHPSQT